MGERGVWGAVREGLIKRFYAHYLESGKCHVVHSPNRAPGGNGDRK